MATIKKRNRTYKITVSCGYDINGRQIRKHLSWTPPDGMTERQEKKELQRQAVLFEEQCRTGQQLNGSIKFADFAEQWLNDYASMNVRENTVNSYRFYLSRVMPAIGHIRLDKLQPHHLQKLYKNLSEEGIRRDVKMRSRNDFQLILDEEGMSQRAMAKRAGVSFSAISQLVHGKNISPESAEKIALALHRSTQELFEPSKPHAVLSNNTIRHYHTAISTVLSTAVEWQIITFNPCTRIRPPKKTRQEQLYLDDTQAAELIAQLNQLPEDRMNFRTAIIMLLFTGMRRSEVLGLYWSDIDLDNGVISVNRSLHYIPQKGCIDSDTKNSSSRRSFKAPAELIPLLKEYKQWQQVRCEIAGDQWHPSERVFTNWNGTPIRPDTLSNQFRKWIATTDLPPIHLHSLRHTNASLLIASGTNIQTVARRLGHSTSATTANIYSHAIQSADAAAAEAVSVFKMNNEKQDR